MRGITREPGVASVRKADALAELGALADGNHEPVYDRPVEAVPAASASPSGRHGQVPRMRPGDGYSRGIG